MGTFEERARALIRDELNDLDAKIDRLRIELQRERDLRAEAEAKQALWETELDRLRERMRREGEVHSCKIVEAVNAKEALRVLREAADYLRAAAVHTTHEVPDRELSRLCKAIDVYDSAVSRGSGE